MYQEKYKEIKEGFVGKQLLPTSLSTTLCLAGGVAGMTVYLVYLSPKEERKIYLGIPDIALFTTYTRINCYLTPSSSLGSDET